MEDNKTTSKSESASPRVQATLPKFKRCLPEDTPERLLTLYVDEVRRTGRDPHANPDTERVLADVCAWVTGSRYHSLLLMGSVGTGKTIMLRALRRYFEPLIPDGMLGTGEIIPGVMLGRAAVIAKFDEYMIESAIHAKMLLIDDFGVEPLVVKSYGTACTPLVDVLCERYERLKPTIISTNLDLEAIGEKYGERLHDRMREVYGSVAFNFKSFRQP